MAPESPGNLIALDLKWNNSRLECDVDRYDSGPGFLYVSWNALECPKYYVPIGNGTAYVWVPEKSPDESPEVSFVHRHYRARVDETEYGFEWQDVAQSPYGAMLILTLPPNHAFVPVSEDASPQFPVGFKCTEERRMACYWWHQPGRFRVEWRMKSDPDADIETQCKRLLGEARRRESRDVVAPVHIDLEDDKKNVPSAQPPVQYEPPPWHIENYIFLAGAQQINQGGGVSLHSERDINIRGSVVGRDNTEST